MNFLLFGRPNVGKSSIYNILTGQKKNIIHIEKGTTRDWHKDEIYFKKNFFLYDTPGITLRSLKEDEKSKKRILESIISKIDCFIFVIDFYSDLITYDQVIVDWLRSFNKEIILIINKKDNNKKISSVDFYKLGIQKIFFISCTHNLGFEKLRKYIKNIKYNKKKNINDKFDYSIAIFGKPNTGKSTFLNTLLNYERSLTSTKAGTTSDYVVENFKYKTKNIIIFDTEGIKRKSKIYQKSIDYHSMKKSLRTIKEVQLIFLLIDSSKGLDRQDKRLINILSEKAQSLILIFNKLDLIKNKIIFKKNVISEIKFNMHQLKNIKVYFISAFIKKQIIKILDYAYKNIFLKNNNINTYKLNKWLKQCTKIKTHPLIDRKKINFKYVVKIKNYPITIKIFCNQSKKINKSYIRFLKNDFNSYFSILNQNINIIFSQSQNPYIR